MFDVVHSSILNIHCARRLAQTIFYCIALIAGFAPHAVAADDLVIERTFFRVTIDQRPVRLEGLVIKRKDSAERLPVALITHGKPSNLGGMLDTQATQYSGQARDMARRGWLAVVVIRRGFGQSDGPVPAPVSCGSKSFIERFDADAADLHAVLDLVAKRDDADPDRAIAIGVSAGGPSVVALSARNPKNLRGAISISGGIRLADCPKDDILVEAYQAFGRASRVPHIWIYAKNDSFFAPPLVERLQTAFLDAGGDMKLVMFDAFEKDGHALFHARAGRLLWMMEMDGFLRFHNLPTWRRQDVTDLMKTMKVEEKERSFVERYVAAPTHKAIAQAPGGNSRSSVIGASSPEEARKVVLESCQRRYKTSEPCTIVLEENVWVGQAPAASQPVRAEPLAVTAE